MRRTLVIFVSAAALSFSLAFIGHRVTYGLMIGRFQNYKDAAVVISVIETLVVFPLMSILVGIFVGWLEQERRWWLAGVSLAPFLGYFLIISAFDGRIFMLCTFYALLSLTAAFTISRWKRMAVSRRKQQI